MIMGNGGMMSSRGNGINSEGNLPHCAAVLVRLLVMQSLSSLAMQFIKINVFPVELVQWSLFYLANIACNFLSAGLSY